MNKDRIQQMITELARKPDRLVMDEWIDANNVHNAIEMAGENHPEIVDAYTDWPLYLPTDEVMTEIQDCGTTCCIAGLAAIMFTEDLTDILDERGNFYETNVIGMGRHHLGLDMTTAESLFNGHWMSRPLEDIDVSAVIQQLQFMRDRDDLLEFDEALEKAGITDPYFTDDWPTDQVPTTPVVYDPDSLVPTLDAR